MTEPKKPAKRPAKKPAAKPKAIPKPAAKGRKGAEEAHANRLKSTEQICAQLSQGITLVDICKQEGFPSVRAVYDWIDKYPEIAAAIARARNAGYDVIANSCLQIADEARNDFIVDDNGHERVNTEAVQRSKLRIWTRLELLKKWDPKRYGDSLKVDAEIKVSRADEIRKARERAGKA